MNTIKTIRKTNLFTTSVIMLLLFSLIGFWGCEGYDNIDIPNYEIYQKIGIEHNNGLDYVFEELKKSDVSKIGLKSANLSEDIFEIAQNATKDFIAKTFDLSDENLSLVNLQIAKAFDKTSKNEVNLKSANAHLYESKTEALLTDTQINFLDELNAIMSDNDHDLKSLQKRIISIENRAVNNLVEEEYAVILAATSVAKYTLEYWSENLDKWSVLLSGNTATLQTMPRLKSGNAESEEDDNFSWKEVGKADVGGAVAAAAGSGVGYLVAGGPVGWKAWAGIVAGGAAAGSVGDAIEQLW